MFGSFFEQDYLLNLFNLGVMQKDDLNVNVFQNRNWGPLASKAIARLLSEKKYGSAATSSYSATGEFLRYIYSVLVAKNHQKSRSRCLTFEFFFTDIF